MYRVALRLLSLVSVMVLAGLAGCGGGTSVGLVQTLPGPSIATQPANQSVPMGLSGSFAVGAVGSGLHYQWSRGGSVIAGATATTYTTPVTAFSDTGETFTVVVSNASGSVTSDAATLTVTARAPKAGDLRFQQVDAESTVNGYAVEISTITELYCPPPGAGGSFTTFGSATGTGFFLVNAVCSWQWEPHALPPGVTGRNVGYAALPLQDYPNLVDGRAFPGFPGFSDPSTVVTGLAFVPNDTAAAGYIQSANSSGFDQTQYTVAASQLQDSVAQEGLKGRVVTAVAYDGVQATFFSYGWTGDPSAVYDAKAVFANLDTATSLAEGLANDGYIITATGSTQAADGSGVILIGTRVQGDTMPRPVLIGDVFAGTIGLVLAQGYAVVAVVTKVQGDTLVLKNYIGER